jgi:hypothetical protein
MYGTCSSLAIGNTNQNLVGKPEWKRPLRRHKLTLEDTIKVYLREIGLENCECVSGYESVTVSCERGNKPHFFPERARNF